MLGTVINCRVLGGNYKYLVFLGKADIEFKAREGRGEGHGNQPRIHLNSLTILLRGGQKRRQMAGYCLDINVSLVFRVTYITTFRE